MPLKSGSSQKTISSNISELMHGEVGADREKAIHTYMKKHNCDYETAKRKIAVAIAMFKSRE